MISEKAWLLKALNLENSVEVEHALRLLGLPEVLRYLERVATRASDGLLDVAERHERFAKYANALSKELDPVLGQIKYQRSARW